MPLIDAILLLYLNKAKKQRRKIIIFISVVVVLALITYGLLHFTGASNRTFEEQCAKLGGKLCQECPGYELDTYVIGGRECTMDEPCFAIFTGTYVFCCELDYPGECTK